MLGNTAGSELLRINAAKDLTTNTANNQLETVGNNQQLTVAEDQTTSVGGDQELTVASNQAETIGGDQQLTISADHLVNVGGNQKMNVAGSTSTSVGGAVSLNAETLLISRQREIVLRVGSQEMRLNGNGLVLPMSERKKPAAAKQPPFKKHPVR